jgi:hypothetical protein
MVDKSEWRKRPQSRWLLEIGGSFRTRKFIIFFFNCGQSDERHSEPFERTNRSRLNRHDLAAIGWCASSTLKLSSCCERSNGSGSSQSTSAGPFIALRPACGGSFRPRTIPFRTAAAVAASSTTVGGRWDHDEGVSSGSAELNNGVEEAPHPFSGSSLSGACGACSSEVRRRPLQVRAPGCVRSVGKSGSWDTWCQCFGSRTCARDILTFLRVVAGVSGAAHRARGLPRARTGDNTGADAADGRVLLMLLFPRRARGPFWAVEWMGAE